MFKLVSVKYIEKEKVSDGSGLLLSIYDDRDDTTEEIDASVVFVLAKSGIEFEGIRLSDDTDVLYISALVVADKEIIDYRYYENGKVTVHTESRYSSADAKEISVSDGDVNYVKEDMKKTAELYKAFVSDSNQAGSGKDENTQENEHSSISDISDEQVKSAVESVTGEEVSVSRVHDEITVEKIGGTDASVDSNKSGKSAPEKKSKKSNDCGGAKAMTLAAISILKGAGVIMTVENTETGEIEKFDFREIKKSPKSVILGGVCNTVDFASSDFTYFVGSAFSVALAEGVSWDFKLKDAMLQAVDAITKVKGTDGKAVRLYARCCGRDADSIKTVEPFSEELGIIGQRYRVRFTMKA